MIKSNLPVILLKNLVLLPYQEVRVEIKSEISKKVTDISKLYHDSEVLIVCPLNSLEENPDVSDLPKIGVVGKIRSVIDLPNGNKRVIINGIKRVRVISYVNYSNESEVLDSIITNIDNIDSELESTAYLRKLLDSLNVYVEKNPFMSNAVLSQIKDCNNLDKVSDIIGGFLPLSFEKKLSLSLDISSISRSKFLIKQLAVESAVMDLEGHIDDEIKKGLDEEQKEFILKEKLKVIKSELGETSSKDEDIKIYKERLRSEKLPLNIINKLTIEIERYSMSSDMSPDTGIIRNYIEYLFSVPWYKETKDISDLTKIEHKLNTNHYGLIEAKNRIVEYVAVKNISPDINSPIICLVGPPGVGKTTFAISIAQCLNRKFVKISLGGMSDSAELVGHRRAYIGSTPGKIVSSLIKCGSKNPVFLLDEVDKLKKDYKGDPASTLLDILDANQNNKFTDNYLDEEVDLSKVLFILTANSVEDIPNALLDRLEIINIEGYIKEEKELIAQNYVIPNILKSFLIKNNSIKFESDTISNIIDKYTSEVGVRSLERCINKIIRKVITKYSKEKKKINNIKIKPSDLESFLGQELNSEINHNKIDSKGVVKAVSKSSNGGMCINIECSSYTGSGKVSYTGSIGNITKESILVSISYIKSHLKEFKIDEHYFETHDIHINFTSSSLQKDGPSAGLAIITSILSNIKNKVISNNITMSGEVTLKGSILKVGGLKEKSIACIENNIEHFYIPSSNINDIKWIDENIKKNINYIYVDDYMELYEKIFS